jgi:hypothetical protein
LPQADAAVPFWQVFEASQHPFGQVLELQGRGVQRRVDELQVSALVQVVQTRPPEPQAVPLVPGTQMFWRQHPLQFEESQVTEPPEVGAVMTQRSSLKPPVEFGVADLQT